MSEISNNVIAALLMIFIIMNMFQTTIYITGVDTERILGKATVGLAGFCVGTNDTIEDMDNQTTHTYTPYFYDVNTTSNNQNMIFYDTFDLFNITPEGYINFTANDSDIGEHIGFIKINDSCGNFIDEHFMKFTILTNNHAPVLDFIPNQSIEQNDKFFLDVNATDIDNDPLTFGDNSSFFDINRENGFISFTPVQDDVGSHDILIYVFDDRNSMDSQNVNFNIIDVNDAPVLDTIGSQTAIINYTYNLVVNATDVDTTFPHNLTFGDNATFFDINPSTGVINFTAVDGQNGTYTVNITVTDGILWDWEAISFTITPENRPPNITSWNPSAYEQEIFEGEAIKFIITAEDPDGTTPSAQWYMDSGALSGATNYTYNYYASPGTSGYHNITVVASDGDLTDSHGWEVYVKRRHVSQPQSSSSSTGSGSPNILCMENWRCTEWEPCRVDGYQIRRCRDINKCGTNDYKPETVQNCTYYAQPSCDDGIQNCHHGGCEILTDCGGPCPACPTCDDGIINQGEQGIDCGGPCPACIEIQKPVTGEEKPKPNPCGNNICEKGELFTCMNDCGGTLVNYIAVILITFGIILLSLRFYENIVVRFMKLKRIFMMAVGKKMAPVMTAPERKGTEILYDLDLLKKGLNKDNVKESFEKLSEVMRRFFSSYAHKGADFTYIELNESVNGMKIKDDIKKKISNFSMSMTKMEFGGEEIKMADMVNMISLSILIVERLMKLNTEKAVKIHKAITTFNKNSQEESKTEEKNTDDKKKKQKSANKKFSFSSFFKKKGTLRKKAKTPEIEKDLEEAIYAKPSEKLKTENVSEEKEKAGIIEKKKGNGSDTNIQKKSKNDKKSPFFVFREFMKTKVSGSTNKAEGYKENVQKTMKKEITPKHEKEESDTSKGRANAMDFAECKSEIVKLLDEAERLNRLEDYKKAKLVYQEARKIYDEVGKEDRKKLHKETVRFIKLYNEIISNI